MANTTTKNTVTPEKKKIVIAVAIFVVMIILALCMKSCTGNQQVGSESNVLVDTTVAETTEEPTTEEPTTEKVEEPQTVVKEVVKYVQVTEKATSTNKAASTTKAATTKTPATQAPSTTKVPATQAVKLDLSAAIQAAQSAGLSGQQLIDHLSKMGFSMMDILSNIKISTPEPSTKAPERPTQAPATQAPETTTKAPATQAPVVDNNQDPDPLPGEGYEVVRGNSTAASVAVDDGEPAPAAGVQN